MTGHLLSGGIILATPALAWAIYTAPRYIRKGAAALIRRGPSA